jgi:hypothetical protein
MIGYIYSNRGEIIFSSQCSSRREAIEKALKSKVSFRYADLTNEDFSGLDLSNINFYGADLEGSLFSRAKLNKTNFSRAFLAGSDFRNTNIKNAILSNANGITYCKFSRRGKKYIVSKHFAVPKGKLVGYKKIQNICRDKNVICTLEIPAKAKRIKTLAGKCRAEYAIVRKGNGYSFYQNSFIYKEGSVVKPEKKFNDDSFVECASGIHFFLTKKEAQDY